MELKKQSTKKKKRYFALPIVLLVLLYCAVDVIANEEPAIYPGYPYEFDKEGWIDSSDSDVLVINDSIYLVEHGTSFHFPKGKVNRSSFNSGDKVGVLLGEENKLQSVWLIEKGSKDDNNSGSTATNSEGSSEIYLEDGVWKN